MGTSTATHGGRAPRLPRSSRGSGAAAGGRPAPGGPPGFRGAVRGPDGPQPAPRWGIASFPEIGTTARVLVTTAQRLGDAVETVSSQLEQLDVNQDIGAKVVVNERTGTIIMGEHVRVSRVALAHGNLNIAIRAETQVSQPNALSNTGQTQVVTNTDVQVGEEVRSLSIVGGEITLGDVVAALNALGATPRDLISIFYALKRAGALNAELEVI